MNLIVRAFIEVSPRHYSLAVAARQMAAAYATETPRYFKIGQVVLQ
jgi:hypothetical protein